MPALSLPINNYLINSMYTLKPISQPTISILDTFNSKSKYCHYRSGVKNASYIYQLEHRLFGYLAVTLVFPKNKQTLVVQQLQNNEVVMYKKYYSEKEAVAHFLSVTRFFLNHLKELDNQILDEWNTLDPIISEVLEKECYRITR